jgi:carbonic anhydrase
MASLRADRAALACVLNSQRISTMNRLIRGVHRFYRDVYLPRKDTYLKSLDSQEPAALFVTCSDSRLDPQAHVQAGPGELFVLRNAGNLIPPYGTGRGGESATIEYAIAGLKIRNIIVCGHSHCGAVKALLDLESHGDLPETTSWLRHAESTRRIVDARCGDLPFGEKWKVAVEQNVLNQLDNLRTHPVVALGLAHGELHIYGWVTDLETGRIRSFDPDQGRFVDLPGGPDDNTFEIPTSIPDVVHLAVKGSQPGNKT